MMAGKIISATKLGISSARVMGTCAIGGQAVGTAAAMCIKIGVSPRGLLPYIDILRDTLVRDDCYIPGYAGDEHDLAKTASVTATSERRCGLAIFAVNGINRAMDGKENCWISDGISRDGETLTLRLVKPSRLSEVRITFDSNFNYAIKITLSDKRRAQQRIGVPPELVRDFCVRLKYRGRTVAEYTAKDNILRFNIIRFDCVIADTVELTVTATNGASNARVFGISVYGDEINFANIGEFI